MPLLEDKLGIRPTTTASKTLREKVRANEQAMQRFQSALAALNRSIDKHDELRTKYFEKSDLNKKNTEKQMSNAEKMLALGRRDYKDEKSAYKDMLRKSKENSESKDDLDKEFE